MDEELDSADELTLQDLLDKAAAGRPVQVARHGPTRVDQLQVTSSKDSMGILVGEVESTIEDAHVGGVFVS